MVADYVIALALCRRLGARRFESETLIYVADVERASGRRFEALKLDTSKNLGESSVTCSTAAWVSGRKRMARQVGMFDVEERLLGLTKKGYELQ